MEKKIAVLSDAAGAPATLQAAEAVIVYERMEQIKKDWQEISRMSFLDQNAGTPDEIRRLVESIADQIGNVKVILGSDISGVSYSALNRLGFLLCESNGISDEFLDDLFEELESDEDVLRMEDASVHSPQEKVSVLPNKTITEECGRPGYFFIDLREVQKSNPSLSSKKILRPFFADTPFIEIIVLCDHQPPWFETELPGLGLALICEKVDGSALKLTVTHVSCH